MKSDKDENPKSGLIQSKPKPKPKPNCEVGKKPKAQKPILI